MRLLLDTHFILWLATDRGRLTVRERATLEAGDTEVIVPAVGLWELTIKWNALGKRTERRLDVSPSDIYRFVQRAGWDIAPLDGAIATAALKVPLAHNDPFDRLLLVQAQQLAASLLTRDEKLAGHPLVLTP